MLKKALLTAILLLSQNHARAAEVLVDRPSGVPKGLVVIAPAKKYLMKERLFAELAERLTGQGYVTVRMNWSPETLQVPELEIQRASDDIQQVVLAAQSEFGFNADQTVLISKSFSTKALGPSLGLAKKHFLLTPNCSAEAPFLNTYGKVLSWPNIELSLIISNEDPYCDVNQIRQTLNSLGRSSWLWTTHGDHNFVLPEQSTDLLRYRHQDEVINKVVDQVTQVSNATDLSFDASLIWHHEQSSSKFQPDILCTDKEHSIRLTIKNNLIVKAKNFGWLEYEIQKPLPISTSADGIATYEFFVGERDDSNTLFDIAVKDGKVVGRELYVSGNDSDNYYGYKKAEGDAAFICSEL
jgi:hypothetical protein